MCVNNAYISKIRDGIPKLGLTCVINYLELIVAVLSMAFNENSGSNYNLWTSTGYTKIWKH